MLIIENLYEHYRSVWAQTNGVIGAMPSFEKEPVQSLATQLGVWPLSAVRKFQKLEQRLMVMRNELIAEYGNSDRSSEDTRSWLSDVEFVSMPKRHYSASLSEKTGSSVHMLDSRNFHGSHAPSSTFQSRDSAGRLSVDGLSLNI